MTYSVHLGWSVDEMLAWNVARLSVIRPDVAVHRLGILGLRDAYARPTIRMPNGQLFDELSDAPMSTEHAIARFFVPYVEQYQGWALFTDGDVLFRTDIAPLFREADPAKAVYVVPHGELASTAPKKDGHIQQPYFRKNWSSVMLFNCGHPANRRLTPDLLNTWPGRDLHAFRWLEDDALIGRLDPAWNYLVGVSPYQADPWIVHYTLGVPSTPGHEYDQCSDEWYAFAKAAGYKVKRRASELSVL
jgi:hypothetical protein